MNEAWLDELQFDLSPRARRFLGQWGRRGARIDIPEGSHGSTQARALINGYNRRFSGISFPVLGGELQGWMRLGARTGKMRKGDEGRSIFTCAEPQFVQCGLACRDDGNFGVSWADDFVPWYRNIEHLLEASAVWSDLLGWPRVGSYEGCWIDLPVASLAAEIGRAAPFPGVRWWASGTVSVCAEPSLTYVASGLIRYHVFAKSLPTARRILEDFDTSVAEGSMRRLDLPFGDRVSEPTPFPFS